MPHVHDAKSGPVHDEHHEHDHPHAVHAASELSDACSHAHFWWFGFQLMSPPDSGSDDSEPQRLQELAISPLSTGPASVASTQQSQQLAAALWAAAEIETRLGSLHFADPFASVPAGAVFLCDAARHERSGVQLA